MKNIIRPVIFQEEFDLQAIAYITQRRYDVDGAAELGQLPVYPVQVKLTLFENNKL